MIKYQKDSQVILGAAELPVVILNVQWDMEIVMVELIIGECWSGSRLPLRIDLPVSPQSSEVYFDPDRWQYDHMN